MVGNVDDYTFRTSVDEWVSGVSVSAPCKEDETACAAMACLRGVAGLHSSNIDCGIGDRGAGGPIARHKCDGQVQSRSKAGQLSGALAASARRVGGALVCSVVTVPGHQARGRHSHTVTVKQSCGTYSHKRLQKRLRRSCR